MKKIALLFAICCLSVMESSAANRVWAQTNAVWTVDFLPGYGVPPWAGGLSFANGDDVYFEDVTAADGRTYDVDGFVKGQVLPFAITISSEKSNYLLQPYEGDTTALIGGSANTLHPNITKTGSGSFSVGVPIYVGDITVESGSLYVTNMLSPGQKCTVKDGALLAIGGPSLTGDVYESGLVLALEPTATAWLHSDASTEYDITLPTPSTPLGGNWWFPAFSAPKLIVQSNAFVWVRGTYTGAYENGDNTGFSVFDHGGAFSSIHLNGGTLWLTGGVFTVANLLPATTPGNRASVRLCGMENTQVAFTSNIVQFGNANVTLCGTGTTVTANNILLGADAYSGLMNITNGSKLVVANNFTFDGQTNGTPSEDAFARFSSHVTIGGQLVMTNGYPYGRHVFTVASNAVLSVGGIAYGSRATGYTQRVYVGPLGTLELGSKNSGENLGDPGNSIPTDILGDSIAGLALAGGTMRFTDTVTNFNQNFYIADNTTNRIDMEGHQVLIGGGIYPLRSPAGSNIKSRFEVVDSDPLKRGRFTFAGGSYRLSNTSMDNQTQGLYNGFSPQNGLQLVSGTFRIASKNSRNKGTALRGGILEVGSLLFDDTYSSDAGKRTPPVSIYYAQPGSIIRICIPSGTASAITGSYVSSKSKNVPDFSMADMLRMITYTLVDKDTGAPIKGAHYRIAQTGNNNPEDAVVFDWDPAEAAALADVKTLTWIDNPANTTWATNSVTWYINDNSSRPTNAFDSIPLFFTNITHVTSITQDYVPGAGNLKTVYAPYMYFKGNTMPVSFSGSGAITVDGLTNTAGCVTTFNIPLTVSGDIRATAGSVLTATNLLARSTWHVDAGGYFRSGFYYAGDTLSVMVPYITNNGILSYDMNYRTETMSAQIRYDQNPAAYYILTEGTMQILDADTDYLKRNTYTNVWVGKAAILKLLAANALGADDKTCSPIAIDYGGEIEVGASTAFGNGLLLKDTAKMLVDEYGVAKFTDGAKISATRATASDPYVPSGTPAGLVTNVITDYIHDQNLTTVTVKEDRTLGTLNFDGEQEIYVATNTVLYIDAPLTGTAHIRKTGPGTLVLAGTSTIEGSIDVEKGTLELASTGSVGGMAVTTKAGATLQIDESARPIRLTRSIAMETGSHMILGPDTATIEPINPVYTLVDGQITFQSGVTVTTTKTTSKVGDGEQGVSDAEGFRTYGYARPVSSVYVDLFGIEQQLIWDVGSGYTTGPFFSVDVGNNTLSPDSHWHFATDSDPSLGYGNNGFVNFYNAHQLGINFIGPLTATLTAADTQLLPNKVTFHTNQLANVTIVAGGSNSQLGNDTQGITNHVVIRSLGPAAYTLDLPVYPWTFMVRTNSTLNVLDVRCSIVSAQIDAGGTLRYGTRIPGGTTLNVSELLGDGTIIKTGAEPIMIDLAAKIPFAAHIGLEQEQLTLGSSSIDPADDHLTLLNGISLLDKGDGYTGLLCLSNACANGELFLTDGFVVDAHHNSLLTGNMVVFKGAAHFQIDSGVIVTNVTPIWPIENHSLIDITGGGTWVHEADYVTVQANDIVRPDANIGAGTTLLIPLQETVFGSHVTTFAGLVSGSGTVYVDQKCSMLKGCTIFMGKDRDTSATNCTINARALSLIVEEGTEWDIPSTEGSINMDVTALGPLVDSDVGTILLKVRGTKAVISPYKYKLLYDTSSEDKWAIRVVKVAESETEYEGFNVILTKAHGAVLLMSPNADDQYNFPASVEDTTVFNASGVDYAYMPTNFNAGLNLRAGAIIRDRYTDRTSGVTADQLAAFAAVNPNLPYWFWYTGGNGCWEEKNMPYTLNVGWRDLKAESPSYTQFAVSNDVFYGEMENLDVGEVGFFIGETYDADGVLSTNLIARIANSVRTATFDISAVTDPWIVVTVKTIPGSGYEIAYGGTTKTLDSVLAGQPKRVIITGVSPVDNLLLSIGDPNRKNLCYVHDMSWHTDTTINACKRVDTPFDVSSDVLQKVVDAAVANGFTARVPASGEDPVVLYVGLDGTRMQFGNVVSSREDPTPNTGSYCADLVYLLNIPLVCTNTICNSFTTTTTLVTNVEGVYGQATVYEERYAFNLGIVNNDLLGDSSKVGIALSDNVEGTHRLGSVSSPHKVNGYVVLEATETLEPSTAYAPYTSTTWDVLSIAPSQLFEADGLCRIPVDTVNLLRYRNARVLIKEDRPAISYGK